MKAKPSFLVSHCSTLVSSPPEKQQHCLPQGPSFRISGAQLDAWATLNPPALQQSPALMLPCQGGGSSLCLLCICQLPGEGFHYLGSLTCPNSHFQPSLHKRWGTKLIPGTVTTLQLSDQELKIQDTVTWQVCTSSVLENTGCFLALLQQYLLHQTFTSISIKSHELDNFVSDSKSAEPNKNTTQRAKF